MNMEKFQTYPVICEGGLDSNQNYIYLSSQTPGAATQLINYEPSLYGGYRKLSGFSPLEASYSTVDSAGAEGKIYGLSIFNNGIITARKTQATSTYKFYYWTSSADWTAYATGLTHTSTSVDKIRSATFNYDGTEKIAFVDGVNKTVLFNGTTWIFIDPSATGADYANSGGPMALSTPKYITTFKTHVFVAGDNTNPNVVAHSAPAAEYDWTAASGAGQIVVGFAVEQIKVFREELYVFGQNAIKKIVVEGADFVLKDVTSNIGCIASDSVVEINGDLLFLSQDGFRTIAGTERVGDIELGVQSKRIQQDVTDLITSSTLSQVDAVIVRKKSQVRFFFSDENLAVASNIGILGGLKGTGDGTVWEWSKIVGIRTSTATSGYINNVEYILHGDYNGKIYRQEIGNDFDGANILSVYQMPYLDFGDIFTRKTLHKITVFIKAEGTMSMNAALQFDWNSEDVINPDSYLLELNISGAVYGEGIYGTSTYASLPLPVIFKNVEGSGMSARLTFTTDDTNASYSIQAVVFEYAVNGRK